jgi:hypothetical protein
MKKHFFTNSEEIGNNMPHFTNNGFEVVKCPDSIWEVIKDLYKICLQAPVKEEPFAGLHNNAYLYDFEPYIGIVRHIHNSLLPLHESTACLHGRPKEFQGKYFRNFYMHYGVRDLEYVGMRNRK